MNALPNAPPAQSVKLHTAFDLEVTLVTFIKTLFNVYRLDNPTLNLAQATQPEQLTPRIVRDPDEPPVSYDYRQRAQTLALKVPPRVVRGRIPRTVTGEIDADKLADVPSIIVQCVAAQVKVDETIATVRILLTGYDENPDGQGYQDVLNMVEALAVALTSFGQAALDQAYPIVLPIDWKMHEEDTFPHFIAEMTTQWELPSGRPLPDIDSCVIVPAEQITFAPPHTPEPPPIATTEPTDTFIALLTSAKFSPSDDRITLNSQPFHVGDIVKFTPQTVDDVLPTPLTTDYYYVRDLRINDFRVTKTPDGLPEDITDKGTGNINLWKRVMP